MADASTRFLRGALGLVGGLMVALGGLAYHGQAPLTASLLLGGLGALLLVIALCRPPRVVRRAVEDLFDGD